MKQRKKEEEVRREIERLRVKNKRDIRKLRGKSENQEEEESEDMRWRGRRKLKRKERRS